MVHPSTIDDTRTSTRSRQERLVHVPSVCSGVRGIADAVVSEAHCRTLEHTIHTAPKSWKLVQRVSNSTHLSGVLIQIRRSDSDSGRRWLTRRLSTLQTRVRLVSGGRVQVVLLHRHAGCCELRDGFQGKLGGQCDMPLRHTLACYYRCHTMAKVRGRCGDLRIDKVMSCEGLSVGRKVVLCA